LTSTRIRRPSATARESKPDLAPGSRTLGVALADAAAEWGTRAALIGAERSLTWAELDDEVDRVAAVLAANGVGRGARVGLCTGKRVELVTAFLALARLGAVAAPVNYKAELHHLRDQFDTHDLMGVVLESRFDALVAPICAGRVVIYAGPTGCLGTANLGDAADPVPRPTLSPDDVCYLNATSGTTGRPKAALGTHRNILINAWSGVDGLGFAGHDVFLCLFSAFSHPHELFHRALVTGATAVVVDTMSPRVVSQLVERHRVTWIMAVPSFYEMMLDHVAADARDLSSLRVLEAGGAWVSPATLDRLEQRFDCSFVPVWGSTETHGVVLGLLPGPNRRAGATGTVMAHYEAAVFDRHGRDVAVDEVGELWVRGPAVSSGYLAGPSDAFVDGWYRTSDLVVVDADGFYRFVGRLSDMLKVGGIRVFPLEIERVLAECPGVREAVVIRAEERVRGEVPRAVLRAEAGVTAKDVRVFCRSRLAVYKIPRILEFWSELPHLANGKVDRVAIASTTPRDGRDDR
jgi:long-chain acyl-CoA synthetase